MKLIELLEILASTSAKNEVKTRIDLGYDYTYFYNTILLYLIKSIPRNEEITNIVTREYYNLYELREEDLQSIIPNLYYVYYLNISCGEYIINGFKLYEEAQNSFKFYDEEYIVMIIHEGELLKVSYGR